MEEVLFEQYAPSTSSSLDLLMVFRYEIRCHT